MLRLMKQDPQMGVDHRTKVRCGDASCQCSGDHWQGRCSINDASNVPTESGRIPRSFPDWLKPLCIMKQLKKRSVHEESVLRTEVMRDLVGKHACGLRDLGHARLSVAGRRPEPSGLIDDPIASGAATPGNRVRPVRAVRTGSHLSIVCDTNSSYVCIAYK